jgi:hypothetical protein
MLCRNPKERLPLKEVMQHPWMVEHVTEIGANIGSEQK